MQKEAKISTPGWVGEDEVLGLLHHDLQLKLAYYQSRCRKFEHKYQKTFAEFEADLQSSKEEDFQKWEDFMDWETAENACQEIIQRLQELAAWKT